MSVAQTSIVAYRNHDFSPVKTTVYQCLLKHQPCSDKDIHRRTGLEINSVTGRRNELTKEGYVRHFGYKIDPITKTRVKTWIATERQDGGRA